MFGSPLPGIFALALGGLVLLTAPAAARRLAIVVGYANYANLPPLPICLRSAGAVSDALTKLGFEVSDIRDAANGATSAALDAFARQSKDADFVAIYACGYVTGFDGRPFLLPVSATMARPSDVLTQGLLAKSFLNLVRGVTMPALVVLDAVPIPGSGAIGLGGMVHGDPLRPGLFVATATANDPADPLTPLAAATIAALGPDADAAGMLASLGGKLDAGASLATAGTASEKIFLVPRPATPAPAPPPPNPAPPPPVAAPAPPEAPPVTLAEGDRRRVQAALRQLGLYSGAVDGVFGAETATAVRRFQMVRGVEANGRLDAAQTLQLLGMAPKAP